MSYFILLFSFCIYLLTLGPSFNFLDSPEFIAFSYRLDIPHPPGHPLYPMLGKLSTFIPFGSIALKVNLLSAIFASLTAIIIYHLIHTFLGLVKHNDPTDTNSFIIKTSSVVCTLSIIFTYSYWIQAVRAEVYSLNSFFVSLLIFLLIRFVYNKQLQPKYFLIFSFVLGLAYCNHTLAITLLLPAFFFLVICIKREIFKDIKLLSLGLFFFIIGLSIYLYLPVRSSGQLYIDWGNPENLNGFLTVVSGYQYKQSFSFPDEMQLINNLKNHFSLFSDQLTYSFTLFAAIGLIFLIKKDFFLSLFTLILFIIGLAGTVLQPRFISINPDSHGYLFTSFLMIAIWLSYGIYIILDVLHTLSARLNRMRSFEWNNKWAIKTCSILLLLTPITIFSISYSYADKSDSYFPQVFTKKILNSLRPNSIIFSRGDEIMFPFWYNQVCENRYQNLIVIDQSQLGNIEQAKKIFNKYEKRIKFPPWQSINHWFQTLTNETINEIVEKDPFPAWEKKLVKYIIFFNIKNYDIYYQTGDGNLLSKSNLLPKSIIYKIQKNSLNRLTPDDLKEVTDFWNWMNKQLNIYSYLSSDPTMIKFYSNEYYNLANYFFHFKLYNKAVNLYKNSIKLRPEMVRAHLNLGICYLILGLTDEAIRETEMGIALDPNNATAYNNLGFIYLQKKNFKKTESYLLKALELNPKHKKAQENYKKLKSIKKNKEL